VANGHINDVRPLGMPYQMEPQLFRNTGPGRFRDVSDQAGPYFREPVLGRGAAIGDLDNDGAPDVVVTHLAGPPAVLRNETVPLGGVLRLSLAGRAPGKTPIGAKVTVRIGSRTLTRIVAGGTSYLSANDTQILIGLGPVRQADRVEVRWPSGRTQSWSGLRADQDLLIEEGHDPRPRPVASPRSPRGDLREGPAKDGKDRASRTTP
jgi:enediyne biosynthesis protein E4